MLRISLAQKLIAEKRKRSMFNAYPKHRAWRELKSRRPSVMDDRESLAKGTRCVGDLRSHVRADQRASDEDSAVEPSRCGLARSGVDGFNRRNDARARVCCGQLRHAGLVARDDADRGVPLPRALFRMGGRRYPEVFPYAGAAVALSDAYFGDSVRAAS